MKRSPFSFGCGSNPTEPSGRRGDRLEGVGGDGDADHSGRFRRQTALTRIGKAPGRPDGALDSRLDGRTNPQKHKPAHKAARCPGKPGNMSIWASDHIPEKLDPTQAAIFGPTAEPCLKSCAPFGGT